MRLAICWEDHIARDALTEAVGAQLVCRNVAFSMREYRRLQDVLYELEDGWSPDVLILGANKAVTAERDVALLRATGFAAKVIVVSADDECAVRGYDWGIDGFWPWPIDPEYAVERLIALATSRHQDCLVIRCRRALYHVHYAHIVCVESSNNKCIIHRDNDETLTVYARLDDLEAQLNDTRFLRCHQSFLINMDHVQAVDKQFELTGGLVATICQRRLKSVREQYGGFIEKACPTQK